MTEMDNYYKTEPEKKNCQYCQKFVWTAPLLSLKNSDGSPNFDELTWTCLPCLKNTKQALKPVLEMIKSGTDMDFGKHSKQINSDIRNNGDYAEKLLLDIITTMEAKLEVQEMLEK